jgi:Tfp pilus assembly protein PilO
MKAMRDYVDDTRKDLPKDSEIQNLVDGITDLINSTIYKLENLK